MCVLGMLLGTVIATCTYSERLRGAFVSRWCHRINNRFLHIAWIFVLYSFSERRTSVEAEGSIIPRAFRANNYASSTCFYICVVAELMLVYSTVNVRVISVLSNCAF